MSNLSPCIKVCSLDEVRRICVGCGRSLEEIARWSSLDEAQRLAITARLPERLASLGAVIDGKAVAPAPPLRALPAA